MLDPDTDITLSHQSRRDEEAEIGIEDVPEVRAYWSCSLIGMSLTSLYHLTVRDRYVTKPQMLLHEDGYYVFRFGGLEDSAHILKNG